MPQQPPQNDLLDQMKKKCGLKVFRCPQFATRSLGVALGLTVMVAVNGCDKKTTPASTVTTQSLPTQSSTPTTSVRTFDQPTVAQTQHSPATTQAAVAPVNTGPDLAEINRTLIRWIVRNRRPPGSFEEFASSAGAQIPPAPAGKKYIIGGNMHVQLVNR